MPLRFSASIATTIRGLQKPCHTIAVSLVLVLATGLLRHASATSWFVDGANGNDAGSGAQDTPLRTVWQAWTLAQPGDAIYLLPTTLYGPIYLGGKAGLPGREISLIGASPATGRTRISGMGKNFGVMLD